jgi:hypothetical protein
MRDGSSAGKRAPKNVFTESNLYTITRHGKRDLRLEHGLSTIEDEFVRLRPKIERQEKLSTEEAGWLLAFAAAALARTPAMRTHQQEQFGAMLRMAEDIKASFERMPSEEKRVRMASLAHIPSGKGAPLDMERLRRTAEKPLQEIMSIMIAAQLKAFAQVNVKLGILCHDFDPGFVTSDAPCVWFDPATIGAPPLYRGVGLASPTTEVTLPITPKRMLILSHQRRLEGYVAIKDEFVVHELNRRSVAHCDREFVSSRPTIHPWWVFEMQILESGSELEE